jgi:hypothetical protein
LEAEIADLKRQLAVSSRRSAPRLLSLALLMIYIGLTYFGFQHVARFFKHNFEYVAELFAKQH